ncbi:hypothetical protein C9374_008881 [Naegleria lovaniensis]|uniref:Uncharacterized protein n=1 Tax=Naegleria lovaniensis TaxID=51637 RepID=A0AA88GJW4_NAELO|nr:uncharacterized protein C9374_008881 [Naegleria lovaniensis]KAG2377796.1 hypothetical protein C9374_008881 [Naegleria lovaniensis]
MVAGFRRSASQRMTAMSNQLTTLFLLMIMILSCAVNCQNDYHSYFDNFYSGISKMGIANIAIQLSQLDTSSNSNNRTILFSKSYVHENYRSNSQIGVDSIYMTGPTMSQLFTKLISLKLIPKEKRGISMNEILKSLQSKVQLSDSILGDYVSWSRMFPMVDSNSHVTIESIIQGKSGFDYRTPEDLYQTNNPQSSSTSLLELIENNILGKLAPRVRQANRFESRMDIDGTALLGYLLSKMNSNMGMDEIFKSQWSSSLKSTFPIFSSDMKDNSKFVKATKEKDFLVEDTSFPYFTIFPVTSSVFTSAEDLNTVGALVMSQYSEKEWIDYNLMNYMRHNVQTYYYQMSKQGNYMTAIILFPKSNLVLSMTGLSVSLNQVTQLVQDFAYRMLPNVNCSQFLNMTLSSDKTSCVYTTPLVNLEPFFRKSYFMENKNKYAGCYMNTEYSHSTFRKYFSMKEMICIDSSNDHSQMLTGRFYNYDTNNPNSQSRVFSEEFILLQDLDFDSFRMGHKLLSDNMAQFDNYVSNVTWTFKSDSTNRFMYLIGPYDTQRYERFEDGISMFLIYLCFGAPFVVGFVLPFVQLFFLVFEVRDRVKNGYSNLANVDLSHIMLSGGDYHSESDESDRELDDHGVENSLRRYSFRVSEDQEKNKKKKKKKKNASLNTKMATGKKWSIIVSVFSFNLVSMFFFAALKGLNIILIFGIWQQWYALLVVPLVTICLTALCTICSVILLIVRIKIRTVSGWVFSILYLLYILLDIAFIVILMKINWFGFWNIM